MCIYKHPDQRHHPRFRTCSATMHGACMHHTQCITIISKNSISSIRFHLRTMSCIIILMTTTLVWCWLASCAQPPFHHHHHDHQSQDHHQHIGDPWQVVGSLQTLLLTSWLFIIIITNAMAIIIIIIIIKVTATHCQHHWMVITMCNCCGLYISYHLNTWCPTIYKLVMIPRGMIHSLRADSLNMHSLQLRTWVTACKVCFKHT